MTENYKKRLVELAKECYEVAKKVPVYCPVENKETEEWLIFISKFNHLIGYILALEEFNNRK